MSRPESINNEPQVINKLRKDQHRKIKDLIAVNSKFPLIALGLVKDYCKGIAEVKCVRFDSDQLPKKIEVHTPETSYHLSIVPEVRVPKPTLG
jgi:hypothetical protein